MKKLKEEYFAGGEIDVLANIDWQSYELPNNYNLLSKYDNMSFNGLYSLIEFEVKQNERVCTSNEVSGCDFDTEHNYYSNAELLEELELLLKKIRKKILKINKNAYSYSNNCFN